MTKNKLAKKQLIGFDDMIMIVEKVVSGYFQDEVDDNGIPNGNVLYTPYFKDQMLSALFVQYAVTGIEYEENEDHYVSIISDSELMKMYGDWKARCAASTRKSELYNQFMKIESLIDEKLEVEKQKYIRDAGMNKEIKALIRAANSLVVTQRKSLERQNEFSNLMTTEEQVEFARKMVNSNFNMAEIAKEAVKMYNKGKDKEDKVVPIPKE